MTPQILRALYEKKQEAEQNRTTIHDTRARKANSITGPRRYL